MYAQTVIAAIALPAGAAAPAAYLYAYNESPAHGEVVTIDVILNARDHIDSGGDFAAWQFGEFRVHLKSTGDPIPASAILPIADNSSESEPVFNRPAGGWFGLSPSISLPWTSGVRPAAETSDAFHYGSSATTGGARLQPQVYQASERANNKLVLLSTGNTSGMISTFQYPASSPTFNTLIHTRSVYEVFRFQLLYDDAYGAVRLRLDGNVALGVYPSLGSAAAEFLTLSRYRKTWLNRGAAVASIGEPVPAPAGGVVGVATLSLASRRRRQDDR